MAWYQQSSRAKYTNAVEAVTAIATLALVPSCYALWLQAPEALNLTTRASVCPGAGFSRLVLEHKVRPNRRLAAVFATRIEPMAIGGLAGLVLRLSQDGHGDLTVVGPHGTARHLQGLQHVIRWRHPTVRLALSSPLLLW